MSPTLWQAVLVIKNNLCSKYILWKKFVLCISIWIIIIELHVNISVHFNMVPHTTWIGWKNMRHHPFYFMCWIYSICFILKNVSFSLRFVIFNLYFLLLQDLHLFLVQYGIWMVQSPKTWTYFLFPNDWFSCKSNPIFNFIPANISQHNFHN
jgi:hypothetical protein